MERFTFIHLIWADELKFSRPLLNIFKTHSDKLNSAEHAFVTPHRKVYDALKEYDNVFLDESDGNLFNKYAPQCSFVISHGFPGKKIAFSIKKKYKKKIVYRYWGGRRYPIEKRKGHPAHNLYAAARNILYDTAFRTMYDDLAAIGIGNIVDEIDLGDLIKKTPMMVVPYNINGYEAVRKAKENVKQHDGHINVLIGHKSEPLENHIHFIDLLSRYPEDRVQMYLPLSYGDAKYADRISNYVAEKNLKNVHVMKGFMQYEQYVDFLDSMDIGIIECENSLALGNVSLLLSLGKTLYLSDRGVIRKACIKEGVPTKGVDEIEGMSFEEFIQPLDLSACQDSTLLVQPTEYNVGLWEHFLSYLKGLKTDL